jgi:hypothetical protein
MTLMRMISTFMTKGLPRGEIVLHMKLETKIVTALQSAERGFQTLK